MSSPNGRNQTGLQTKRISRTSNPTNILPKCAQRTTSPQKRTCQRSQRVTNSLISLVKGRELDGAHRYRLRFAPDKLPPVDAFWSLTMYQMPESLLAENPINRFLLNSTMLPDFVSDADGGVTLYVQHESPGKEQKPNWLPAPSGPFFLVLRLYLPKAEVLKGTWEEPPLSRVK